MDGHGTADPMKDVGRGGARHPSAATQSLGSPATITTAGAAMAFTHARSAAIPDEHATALGGNCCLGRWCGPRATTIFSQPCHEGSNRWCMSIAR